MARTEPRKGTHMRRGAGRNPASLLAGEFSSPVTIGQCLALVGGDGGAPPSIPQSHQLDQEL
jgi:hypothetical protein